MWRYDLFLALRNLRGLIAAAPATTAAPPPPAAIANTRAQTDRLDELMSVWASALASWPCIDANHIARNQLESSRESTVEPSIPFDLLLEQVTGFLGRQATDEYASKASRLHYSVTAAPRKR